MVCRFCRGLLQNGSSQFGQHNRERRDALCVPFLDATQLANIVQGVIQAMDSRGPQHNLHGMLKGVTRICFAQTAHFAVQRQGLVAVRKRPSTLEGFLSPEGIQIDRQTDR